MVLITSFFCSDLLHRVIIFASELFIPARSRLVKALQLSFDVALGKRELLNINWDSIQVVLYQGK